MSVALQESIDTTQEIANELRAATEIAAIAVGPWVGKGDPLSADQAAVDSLIGKFSRSNLITVHVAIGEGVKDEAPHLPHGEQFGNGALVYDLAVDPVEGTKRTAHGDPGGMVIASLAPRGSFPVWADVDYMRKLVVGPQAARNMAIGGYINLLNEPETNMQEVAAALRKSPDQLRVAVLDRDRNAHIMEAARSLGKHVLVALDSGDVLPALQACRDDQDIDMLYSSGGAPEAVITAAAVAGFGGNMQAMWDPQTPQQVLARNKLQTGNQLLTLRDLVGPTDDIFFSASAITENPLMNHVRYNPLNRLYQRGGSLAVHGFKRPDSHQ